MLFRSLNHSPLDRQSFDAFACTANQHSSSEHNLPSLDITVTCGGLRLSPLGTSVTISPIAPAQNVGWWWVWSNRWNDCVLKLKYFQKTCPSDTSSTTNTSTIWLDPSSNPRSLGEKPVTNRLSYGKAIGYYLTNHADLDSDYESSSDGQNFCTLRGTVRFMRTRAARHSWPLLYSPQRHTPLW
jgi:hypothetical protein